jgi:ABC-type lipoprotein release transport system permease subunit
MAGSLRCWGPIVAKAHSGRRRTFATALYALVLFLASLAFASGLMVRSSVASRWDAAMRRGNGPNLVVTAATTEVLADIGRDERVQTSGARVLTFHDTYLRRGSGAATAELSVDAFLVPTKNAEPAGYVMKGRWLHGVANRHEVVIDVGLANAIGRTVGDRIELTRGTRSVAFTIVGIAVNLGNCLMPECERGTAWLTWDATRDLGEVSYHAWVQGFRLKTENAAAAVAIDAWKKHGANFRAANSSAEIRKLVTLSNGLLGALVAGFGMFALVAAALLVASTTSARLVSLRRDLGLLQVIGASSREVAALVLMQNLLIGALTSLLGGVVVALLRSRLVIGSAALLPETRGLFSIVVVPILIVFLVVEGIVLLSTLIPAISAARLQPIAALRNEPDTIRRPSHSLPIGTLGIAWQTLRRQRRQYAIALLALTITGSAAVAATGFDAAISEFAAGKDQFGVKSDVMILTEKPDEQRRLRAALQPNSLAASSIAATWRYTQRAALVNGHPASARFVDGKISDLGFTVHAGRLPRSRGEAVVGFGLLKSANMRVGSTVTFFSEGVATHVRIVGQVIDASTAGQSITLGMEELPLNSRWGIGQAIRFKPGVSPTAVERELLTMVLGKSPSKRIGTYGAYRAQPYRIAVGLLALSVLGVGCAQLASSILVSTRRRAQDLATLRAIGATGRSMRAAHVVLAIAIALVASAISLPIGNRTFRLSIDSVSSAVGIGAGVPVSIPIGSHIILTFALVALCAVVAWCAISTQLSKSMASALNDR